MGVYEWVSVIKQGNINIMLLTIISADTEIAVLISTSLQVDVFLKLHKYRGIAKIFVTNFTLSLHT